MNTAQPQTTECKPSHEIASFAEWFVRSPLATPMHDGARQFRTFQPLKCREGDHWSGVEITIAWVGPASGVGPTETLPPVCGNGHSSNPHGPLKPGDFGVHSHPDTSKRGTGRRAGD